MTAPLSGEALTHLIDTTWPPARKWSSDGWILRDGAGGGNRVSAATAARVGALPRIVDGIGLVMVRPGEETLDAALAAAGFTIKDPTLVMEADPGALALRPVDRLRAILCERPPALMREIWREDGIGPERLAIMDRAAGPKVYLMGRVADRAAGCAFVAAADDVAVLHALMVKGTARRQRLGADLTIGAAKWAVSQGCARLLLLVTEANAGARALYARLGFEEVGRYHYRKRP
ncbi:MAG: GNAT family N-acetyltransferase [Rubricella sp.]